MILRHLRYFATVVEHGSFVRAARVLRVAQPSLSRQIHSLERETGVSLLDRTPRGIRITPAGRILADGIQAVAKSLDDALRRAQLAHEGNLGTLRLGLAHAALQSPQISRAVAALRRRMPDIRLEVSDVGSFDQVESLLAGDVDLSIGAHLTSDDRGVRREALLTEHVTCAMIAATHPLARQPRIEPSQLKHERLLMIDPAVSRGFPELYRAACDLHEGVVELHTTVESLYNLVAAGRGWVPALDSFRANPPAGTVGVPLAGLDVALPIGLSVRARDRGRLVANAIAILKQETGAQAPTPTVRTCADAAQRVARPPIGIPRGLEARHLRAFAVTVAEGSVNRAAARLGLTQSGLSRRLRGLENVIGIELFRRGPAGIVPTPAGVVFNEDAASILLILDEAVAKARGIQRGAARACRIGAVPSELTGDLLVGVTRHMGERFPDVPLEITELLTWVQVPALRNRDIDVGIGGAYAGVVDDPGIASVQIGEDVVECALLATSHPLAPRAWLTPADLADVSFLFVPRPSHPRFYDSVMQSLSQIGIHPKIEGSFLGARTIWRLVAEGMGWTLGNRTQRTNPPAGIVAVPIEGLRIPTGIQVLWRRDEDDAHVRAVLDVFRGCAVSS